MLQTTNKFLGFVPALIVEYLHNKFKRKKKRDLPEKQSFRSVVMFADISGFTNLTEKLSRKGAEGAELIAFALNRYMELLVSAIGRSGGDIFKFAGDAMIVLWPPPKDNSDEGLVILCRQAIQSALDIQARLNDKNIVDDIKLSVKIGFGIGDVTILHVGGKFGRAEYLAAGEPLIQAFEAEHCAKSGGKVFVSEEVYMKVLNYFKPEKVPDSHHGNFYTVEKKSGVKEQVQMKADALLLTNQLKPSDIEELKNDIKSYIPAAVVPFIELGQEKWSAELRKLTVLFVNLGIDLSDAKTEPGLHRIQQVIFNVQNVVYHHEGSLNKLLMDDKGSTLIVVFGLPPMSHQDDPVRGVLTSLNLISTLRKIDCKCAIGITTGVVFAGVVGTSGNRREYSILGDTVNLAARFMQAACEEKIKKVFVDEETMKEAQIKIGFRFVLKAKVKGKDNEISFYEPIEEDEELASFPFVIRTHLNNPLKGENLKSDGLLMFGRSQESELKKSLELFSKFVKKAQSHMMILLTGGFGAGKSLFLRNFVNEAINLKEKTGWKNGEKMNILINKRNPEVNRNISFNGWIGIVSEILKLFSIREKKSYESLISWIFDKDEEILENLGFIEKILNVKLRKHDKESKKEANNLQSTDKYVITENKMKEQKVFKKFVVQLLKGFVEEDVDIASSSQVDIELSQEGSRLDKKKTQYQHISAPPVLIVLDAMEDFDELSWRLTRKLMKNLTRKLFIIGAVRNEDIEQPIIFKKNPAANKPDDADRAKKYVEEPIDESIKMPGVTKNDDSEISHSKKYILTDEEDNEKTISEQINEAINDLDETLNIDSFYKIELPNLEASDIVNLIRKIFDFHSFEPEKREERTPPPDSKKETRNFLDSSISSSFESIFIEFLKIRTNGRPLFLINLMQNLRAQGYIQISKERNLIISDILIKCIKVKEFLTINAPLCSVQINGPLIDKLDRASLIILKTASVLGDCFDFRTLAMISPLRKKITNDRLFILLDDLVKSGFLEVLDEKDANIEYRFNDHFMRECLYQRMTFSQRRETHRAVATAIQDSQPVAGINFENFNSDRLIYHWSLTENQSGPELLKTSNFSAKAKRSIVVKKISSILSQNLRNFNVNLFQGDLEKKSDKGLSWSPRFCILNTKELKYYYKEADYKASGDPLGSISLKHIYNIIPLDEKQYKRKDAFMILTGSWFKKNKEMGIRNFYFSAKNTELLEEWKTHIEFIRAKAVYDDFVKSFGKISFPLIKEKEDEDLDFTKIQEKENFLKNGSEKPALSKMKSSFTTKKSTRKSFDKPPSEISSSSFIDERKKELQRRLKKYLSNLFLLFTSHIVEVVDPTNRSRMNKEEIYFNLGMETNFIKLNQAWLKERSLEESENNIESSQRKKNFQSFLQIKEIPGILRKSSLALSNLDDLEEKNQSGITSLVIPEKSTLQDILSPLQATDNEINPNANTILTALQRKLKFFINYNDDKTITHNNLRKYYFLEKNTLNNLNYGSISEGINPPRKPTTLQEVSENIEETENDLSEDENYKRIKKDEDIMMAISLTDLNLNDLRVKKGEAFIIRKFDKTRNRIFCEKEGKIFEFDPSKFMIMNSSNLI